jgi:O-antigen chain-terminating methyltransferase
LSALESGSQGAVTGFHIIEHLPFSVLLKVFKECRRVLKPGGIVLFETPDPENVVVGSGSFYLDPTHLRPLPKDLVAFVAKQAGFTDVRVMRVNPVPEKFGLLQNESDLEKRFTHYFYGPQDYAVIGKA